MCLDPVAVGVVGQWPSLGDQIEVSGRLFGPPGPRRVREWVAQQADLVEDSAFARTFSDHVALPGIRSLDYAHRHIRTTHGDVLGGIRFYSRNSARPFVQVIAHSFDDVAALADCVYSEWSAFNVRFLRLRTKPRLLADHPGVILDKSIHLARCRDMAAADGRVVLEPFDAVEQALHLVADRYAQVALTDPVLSVNVSAASPEDLLRWHDDGRLWAIRSGAETVGVLAVAPGATGWIGGQEINEEVIGTARTGAGYACSAQCAWAHDCAADTTDLLIGTIDRHNHASRATALRAGRPRVLDDVFIALGTPT